MTRLAPADSPARRRASTLGAMSALVVAALVGCSAPEPTPTASAPSPTPTPTPTETTEAIDRGVRPTSAVTVVGGLDAPWSIVRLESDSTLVSERDRGVVREITRDGVLRDVGAVPGVVAQGEGGLLGIEEHDGFLYAYVTTASDNRIVRFALTGAAGSYGLGAPEEILTGIPKASNHNGGRIKFGPDGMLYAAVGDASTPGAAQNLGILAGKILRMTPDGGVPDDNPWPGSLVYSLGHRNPQGLAWDADGQLWASEFGQDTWDELNLIVPGGNYGWPDEEGVVGGSGYRNPVAQWPTDEASPSGLAYTDGTFFMASLRGQRLWTIVTDTGAVLPWFVGEFGRLRDVVPGPDGTVWMITNNTDGRGDPRPGDDQLIQVSLEPVA